MRRILSLCLPILGIAGCVPAAEPPGVPATRPTPVVALPVPRATGDWRDWAVTPGIWAYRRDARGSIALFGAAGAGALLTLRCDGEERQLYLARAGTDAGPVAIRTSTATRTLAVQPTGSAMPYVAAALAPDDALLDAMAFSRGHFTVEQGGRQPLVVPSWAEVGRVVEDCRP